MSITISANSRMVGGLFSSMNTGIFGSTQNNAFSGMNFMSSFNYSDYASIRNGSYHKLLSSYYALDDAKADIKKEMSSTVSGSSSSSRTYNYWTKDGKVQRTYDTSLKTGSYYKSKLTTATTTEQTSKLASIESDAEKMTSAADKLLTQGTKSIFNKVTTTDKDGNKTTGYDTDAIYKAASAFVTQYNALTKSAGASNVVAIRSSASSMGYASSQNEKLLSSVGITYNKADNTLSIDEETFKNADMDTVKSLFQGKESYASQVSAKASNIDYFAQYEASKSNTYNNGGAYSYNYSSGSLWNSMV